MTNTLRASIEALLEQLIAFAEQDKEAARVDQIRSQYEFYGGYLAALQRVQSGLAALLPDAPTECETEKEHPAILFNRWYPTAAAGEPFFPGIYTEEQLRGVCYLAFVAGQKSTDATAQIAALKEELEKERSKTPLEEVKGQVDCPKCGSPVAVIVSECCDCGQQWYLHRDELAATKALIARLTAAQEALRTAAMTIFETFARDEAQGYRSRDRQYVVDMLGPALEDSK